MKILALDTSSTACSVGLLLDQRIITAHQIAPMQQAKLILPMLEKILVENNTTLNQLDAIAFGCGPGSFTGVRIAASVTQGIAFAHQLPVIKISSLAAIAQGAFDDLGWRDLLVVIDARMQEVYAAAYRVGADQLVELVDPEMVTAPQNISMPAGIDWYGVGNGWTVYQKELQVKPVAYDDSRVPMARGILRLAQKKLENQEVVSSEEAMPVYLRDKVANNSNEASLPLKKGG